MNSLARQISYTKETMKPTQPEWCGCDGYGNEQRPKPATATRAGMAAPAAARLTRRQALLGAALASVSWMGRDATALADVAVAPGKEEPPGDVLVVIFMRGGADGLNIVVPYGEDAYHRHRQTIGIAAPNDRRAGAKNRALDLTGFFGLHPSLAPLRAIYDKGLMTFVHAIGSGDHTRSHFAAMSAMERGLPDEATGTGSGWLARHLDSSPAAHPSPLRTVAFSNVMPDSLRGATDATALNSLADFRLYAPGGAALNANAPHPAQHSSVALHDTLTKLYTGGKDAVTQAGHETLAVLETLNNLDPAHYRPAHGAVYPTSELGTGLRQVACLLKGHVGLEIACLDHRGPYLWDTHVAQNNILPGQLADIGQSLAAFAADLGDMKGVTTIVMTEFGRRLQENTGLGTDHGRASVMMLMGGGIKGGQVFARWPGLEDHQLEGPGDLRVTTDYRDVLAEILARRVNPAYRRPGSLAAVFPNYQPSFPGLVKI